MTDIYCTKCGKGLHHDDEVVITARATIQAYRFIGYLHIDGNYVELDDAPYEEVLCIECHDKASQPNRVVVELDGLDATVEEIREIRAERPDDVCVIVKDWLGAVGYGMGGSRPIKPLTAVSDPEFEELKLRADEDAAAREEELELHYTGMGG